METVKRKVTCSLKREEVFDENYRTREQARRIVFDTLDC